MDTSSSMSEPVKSATSGSNFYGAGSDDDSDEEGDKKDASKKKDKANDTVTVSDDMAGLAIGDSPPKEYEIHEDHRLLISKALQLLQVDGVLNTSDACGTA